MLSGSMMRVLTLPSSSHVSIHHGIPFHAYGVSAGLAGHALHDLGQMAFTVGPSCAWVHIPFSLAMAHVANWPLDSSLAFASSSAHSPSFGHASHVLGQIGLTNPPACSMECSMECSVERSVGPLMERSMDFVRGP